MPVDEKKNKITASLVSSPVNIATLGLMAVFFVFFSFSGIASASPTHFGSEGEGAGEFSQPSGIAVDNTLAGASAGDVYVMDRGNNRVEKFSAGGEFLLAWGWGVADGKSEFETCGPTTATPACTPGIAGSGAGQFKNADGIAVDSSLGMSAGDVYIEDSGNHRIDKFSEEGVFLLAWGWGVADGKAEAQTCGPEAVTKTCQVGLDGEGSGELGSLGENALGVGPTGSVYVGESGPIGGSARALRFSSGGSFEELLALEGSGNVMHSMTVDSSGDIYAFTNPQIEIEFGHVNEPPIGVREFNGVGAELPPPRDPSAAEGAVVATGDAGELFVDAIFEGVPHQRVDEFDGAGVQTASFDASETEEPLVGVAFSKELGGLYVLTYARSEVQIVPVPAAGPVVESEEAIAEAQGAVTVKARINPEGAHTKYHLDYGLTEAGESEETAPVTMTATEFAGEVVEVKLEGLKVGTTYHFHFVASNTNAPAGNAGADQTFTTLPAVAIESESAAHVTSASAELDATLNPLGLETTYRFEYLTEAEFAANGDGFPGADKPISVPAPEAGAGAGSTGVPESILIEDLTPGTVYHYRVVATNSLAPEGGVDGADRTFTTQSGAGSALIDGRGWEMVSPPDKHGEALEAITLEGGDIQAAEDGSGLAYIAKGPVDNEPQGNRSLAEQQLLANRTSTGWSTQDLATPHEAVAGLIGGNLSEYKLFSSDLSLALVEPEGSTPLSAQATEKTPYLREANGQYTPLVSPADLPEGTKAGVGFVSATPDLAHVLLESPQSLVKGFDAGKEECAEGHICEEALYEWTDGVLTPVSILPGGESAATEGGSALGYRDQVVRNAISANGERVVFATAENGGEPKHLFVRNVATSSSVQLDVPEQRAAGGEGPPEYQDASSDGSRVFFKDGTHLTVGATKSSNAAPDLYMCEVAAIAPGERDCSHHLTDLTVDANAGEAAGVQGLPIGASEDGAYVYFVANGVLSNGGSPVVGAERGDCRVAEPASAKCNLYVWHEGALRLVAVLSGEDGDDWAGGARLAGLQALSARVSPDGQYLAFMSERPLTGFDNRDAHSGERDEEVFEYDAQSGHLACASCNPSGARPAGQLDPGEYESPSLVDRANLLYGRWLAALIPGWTSVGPSTLYQSRYLDDNGRLFFDSPVGLVPGDANGKEDVYEYKPEGVGPEQARCGPGSSSQTVAFKPAHSFETEAPAGGGTLTGEEPAGCVGLISSGTSGEESAFLDASGMGPGGEEGEDVFFLTAAKLSTADFDDSLDVYDAHECSSAVPCPSGTLTVPPACSNTDSCRAAPAPQPEVFGAPPSATFHGPGNVVPATPAKAVVKKKAAKCPKGKVRKTVKHKSECVRAKSKKPRKRKKK